MRTYDRKVNTPQEKVSLASNVNVPDTSGAWNDLGKGLSDLGRRISAIDEARETSQGVAEYNSIVDKYTNSLSDKDPNDFDYVKNFDELNESINGIYENKTIGAVRELKNQFTVWNQINRDRIYKMSFDAKMSIVKKESKDFIDNCILNKTPEAAYRYLSELEKAGAMKKETSTSLINYMEDSIRKNDITNDALLMSPEDAKAYVLSKTSSVDDARKILNDVEFIRGTKEQGDALRLSELNKKGIDTIAKGLLDPTNPVDVISVDKSGISTLTKNTPIYENPDAEGKYFSYKEAIKRAVDGQAKPSRPDYSAKEYNRVFNAFPLYWDGKYGYQKEDMQVMLALEYSDEKSITREHYQGLLSLLDYDMPKNALINYKDFLDKVDSLTADDNHIAELKGAGLSLIVGNPDIKPDELNVILKPYKDKKAKEFLGEFMNKPGGGPVFRNPNYKPEAKPTKKIRVKNKDGQTGSIPEEDWLDAEKEGYLRID